MADAAIACSKQGHQVYFITVAPAKVFYSAKGRETLIQLLKSEKNSVQIISEVVGYEFEFGTPAYRAWVYKKLIARLPAGVPLILSDDYAVWEAATCMQSRYPVVGVMHADENHYYDLVAKYYRQVDVLACVSERVKIHTGERIPDLVKLPLFTIPCGINLPVLRRTERIDDRLQLVFVGRISDYQKRAGDLVKIAALLATSGINFHLTIIGDGNMREELEINVKESGLVSLVTFTGWLSQQEVAKHLSVSDILLLTSDFEGTPIAMMEGLAAGCGMVGTRVSGIEDYEHHRLAKECLGIYQVGDIEAAVEHILMVGAIPSEKRRAAAREMAETEFSMTVCLERYYVALDNIQTHRDMNLPPISLPPGELLYSKMIALARNIKMSLQRS